MTRGRFSFSKKELDRYARLPTERVNPATRDLDTLAIPELLKRLNTEDLKVARAVGRERAALAGAVRLLADAWAAGGRWVFFGAGTSGRLGVIEAAECPPTFGTPPGRVRAVIAGGRGAMFSAKEGAEDDAAAGKRAAAKALRRGDAAVGIAASGVTPFVLAALREARRRGARAILVTANRVPVGAADVVISPRTGPEALTGSTRLKSGTAAKLVLNMLTTASMVRLGKAYGNRLVDLRPTNRKLKLRAIGLVAELGKVTPARAQELLERAGGNPKAAIVMARGGVSRAQARRLLAQSRGFLRPLLAGK